MDNLATTASDLAAKGAIPQDFAYKIQAMDTAYASMDSAIAGQGGLCDSVTALSSGASQLNTGLNTIVGTDNANSKDCATEQQLCQTVLHSWILLLLPLLQVYLSSLPVHRNSKTVLLPLLPVLRRYLTVQLRLQQAPRALLQEPRL